MGSSRNVVSLPRLLSQPFVMSPVFSFRRYVAHWPMVCYSCLGTIVAGSLTSTTPASELNFLQAHRVLILHLMPMAIASAFGWSLILAVTAALFFAVVCSALRFWTSAAALGSIYWIAWGMLWPMSVLIRAGCGVLACATAVLYSAEIGHM